MALSGFEADCQQQPEAHPDVTAANGKTLTNAQLQMQNEQLQAALKEATVARDQWQQLHAQLHSACVDNLSQL